MSINDIITVLAVMNPSSVNWGKLSDLRLDNKRSRELYNSLLRFPEFEDAVFESGILLS